MILMLQGLEIILTSVQGPTDFCSDSKALRPHCLEMDITSSATSIQMILVLTSGSRAKDLVGGGGFVHIFLVPIIVAQYTPVPLRASACVKKAGLGTQARRRHMFPKLPFTLSSVQGKLGGDIVRHPDINGFSHLEKRGTQMAG